MQTRDQLYAQSAFDQVWKISKEQSPSFGKSYGSMAHKLPILIHTSGLAQALEFVNSRGTEGAKRLLDDLSQTVVHDLKDTLLAQSRAEKLPRDILLDHARADDLRRYILLTEKVLAALLWYKRYAQSILDVQEGDEPDVAEESEREAEK